jgi:hypothetical protein
MSTIANTIAVASVTSALASGDIGKGKLFNPYQKRFERYPLMITTERIIIQKIYNNNPSYTNLQVASDYLYDLCGSYQNKAQNIVTGAIGGSVGGIAGFVLPARLEFTVSNTSLIQAGATSITLSAFIGFDVLFVRGGLPQSQISSQPTYYSWNPATGLFSVTPAAVLGEFFQLIPIG